MGRAAEKTCMESRTVECLRCGSTRKTDRRRAAHHLETGECLRCGYVGWAESSELSESARRELRDRPVERRRLHAVA
jgi:Zn ribbon nucleic-acid-binding protein